MAEYFFLNDYAGTWRGRELELLPLPGDEGDVLRDRIRRSQRRDGWYNRAELEVWMCVRTQLQYGTVWCFTPGCGWCGNQWQGWA